MADHWRRSVVAGLLVVPVSGCTNNQIGRFIRGICRGIENCTTYDEEGEPEDKDLRYHGS